MVYIVNTGIIYISISPRLAVVANESDTWNVDVEHTTQISSLMSNGGNHFRLFENI